MEAVETTDIAELFAKDPLKCTRDDIKGIIAEFRSRRHQFNAPKQTLSKKPSKVPAGGSPKALALADAIASSLDDGGDF